MLPQRCAVGFIAYQRCAGNVYTLSVVDQTFRVASKSRTSAFARVISAFTLRANECRTLRESRDRVNAASNVDLEESAAPATRGSAWIRFRLADLD
jgi:hypothetical protein